MVCHEGGDHTYVIYIYTYIHTYINTYATWAVCPAFGQQQNSERTWPVAAPELTQEKAPRAWSRREEVRWAGPGPVEERAPDGNSKNINQYCTYRNMRSTSYLYLFVLSPSLAVSLSNLSILLCSIARLFDC